MVEQRCFVNFTILTLIFPNIEKSKDSLKYDLRNDQHLICYEKPFMIFDQRKLSTRNFIYGNKYFSSSFVSFKV